MERTYDGLAYDNALFDEHIVSRSGKSDKSEAKNLSGQTQLRSSFLFRCMEDLENEEKQENSFQPYLQRFLTHGSIQLLRLCAEPSLILNR